HAETVCQDTRGTPHGAARLVRSSDIDRPTRGDQHQNPTPQTPGLRLSRRGVLSSENLRAPPNKVRFSRMSRKSKADSSKVTSPDLRDLVPGGRRRMKRPAFPAGLRSLTLRRSV